jgi:hypothetical protein
MASGFWEWLAGSKAKTKQFDIYSPEQKKALQQLLPQILPDLLDYVRQQQQPLQFPQPSYEGFEPIEQRALSQFQTNTIPTIAERLTSLGSGPRSTNFRGELAAAGAGLQEALAALRAQYGLGQQQANTLMNLFGQSLAPQTETAYMPATQGALQGGLPGLAKAGLKMIPGVGSFIQ